MLMVANADLKQKAETRTGEEKNPIERADRPPLIYINKKNCSKRKEAGSKSFVEFFKEEKKPPLISLTGGDPEAKNRKITLQIK